MSHLADLDLRRIQMELKGPAGGLLVVALLSVLYWCIVVFTEGGLHSVSFTGEPIEIAGAVASTALSCS